MVTSKIRELLFHKRFVQNLKMTILSFHKYTIRLTILIMGYKLCSQSVTFSNLDNILAG